jgi:sigma-B regulation protein RsbU (phosphoserine phosphatase)
MAATKTQRPAWRRLLARLPLRFVALFLFLAPVLAASASLMTIGFLRGRQSTRELVMSSLQSAHAQVCSRLGDMLSVARSINELNAHLLDDRRLTLGRLEDWSRHLHGQAQTFQTMSCISWDGADGREAWIARYPGGSGYWFGLKDDAAARDVVERPYEPSGALRDQPVRRYDQDPREFAPFRTGAAGRAAWCRPFEWYDESGKPVTFALAFVKPHYDAQRRLLGVLTAQLTLHDISLFLKDIEIGPQDRTFIIDETGRLMADSDDAPLMGATGRPVMAAESSQPLVAAAASWAASPRPDTVEAAPGGAGGLRIGGVECVAVVTPFTQDPGITWRIVTVAPLEAYLATLSRGWTEEAVVAGGIALVTILLALGAAAVALRPTFRLMQHVHRIDRGDLNGRLDLDYSREFRRLAGAINQMTANLRDRLALRRSLALAADVQQGLLPAALPKVPGLDVAATAQYCEQTGGDYYDFPNVCGRASATLPIVVGDVIGHGVPSAMLMAAARGIVRSTWDHAASLADLLAKVNTVLTGEVGELSEGRFVTMLAAVIDPSRRTLRWASAGHDLPMVYSPHLGGFRPLAGGSGLPLGITEDANLEEAVADRLEAGQVVAVGTDGLWEARNRQGDHFGKARLEAVIRDHADRSADEICRAVLARLADFRDSTPPADDLTLVIVKVH